MKILEHQLWYLLFLVSWGFAFYYLFKSDASFLAGELFGISTFYWFIFSLLSPILHQVYVLVGWRPELYYQGITKLFGQYGFRIFKVGFAILILSRGVSILF